MQQLAPLPSPFSIQHFYSGKKGAKHHYFHCAEKGLNNKVEFLALFFLL